MKRIAGFFLALSLLLAACGQGAEAKWQEQYDLGVRYLSEGNYQEAIIAFTAAIEIDPKRSEAYAGAAEAYAAAGDLESALAILQQGYEATGDSGLEEQMAQLEAGLPGESGQEEGQTGDLAWEAYSEGLEAYFAGEFQQALELLDTAIAAKEAEVAQGVSWDLPLFAGAAARVAYDMGDTDAMFEYFSLAEGHMEIGPPYYNSGVSAEWGGINVTYPVTDEGEVTGVIYTLMGPWEEGGPDPEIVAQFEFNANGEPVAYGE